MNHTASVTRFLKSKHIEVSEEWISACIQFLQSESNENNLNKICGAVYEQWLHADITELASSCLPFGLSKKKTASISGKFALQVNSIRDIGRPAYNQLQQIQKKDIENTKVSDDKGHTSAWEPKPTRMLLMQMTDGTSMVQGMEYRSIPLLTLNIKPGSKVLISGTITVRSGMLLLTRDHISILGGEVDSLLISNSIENVLNRHLGLEETAEPAETYNEHENTQAVPPSQGSQYYPSQINRNSQRTPLQPSSMPPPSQRPLQTTNKNKSTATNQNNSRSSISQRTTSDELDMMQDDDFDDFLDSDMEATISQIENQALNNTNQSRGPKSTSEAVDDMFDDDFDDVILSTPEDSMSNINLKKDTAASQPKFQENRNIITPFNRNNNKNSKSLAKQTSLKGFLSPSHNSSQNNVPSTSLKSNSSNMNISQRLGSPTPSPSSLNSSNKTASNSSLSSTFDSGKGASLIDLTLENSRGIAPGTSQHTTEVLETEPPFTYLCFLPSTPSITKEFIIKGFVMTLTSKLQQTAAGWELTVMINDGTASCEVDIQNQVLQNLIGLTVDEMNKKKAEARTNPELKQHLSKCVSGCQRQLISLCGLLHLSLIPGKSKPLLTNITTVTQQHARQLAARARKL